MNLKSHYKMIIAIIIVVILVSSMAIYFYPHNNTHYYNNGDSIHFLYAGTDVIHDYREYNCSVSSYSVGNGKPSYLNSTALIERSYSSCTLGQISFNMNIKTHNINSGNIRVSISANHFCADLTYKNKEYFNDYPRGVSILIGNTGNVNISGIMFGFHPNDTRTVITVSSGKLTNTYYITTQVQSAVYGHVDYTGTYNIDRVNGEFIMENENNSHMNIVDVHNGYYYYFVHPDTGYRIYSIKNSTLKQIGTIGNKTISSGSSYRYVICSDDL
ncbi:MAG: hypothetical protein RE471_08825 [Ferroplasma sp.]|uniref:hypothetical protein n=1 Tax=Ferroplasma sp. TaxID=2591003 RepID=UPI0028166890|nr:hypothetical protein [Ferroplasma sp.]WMT51067.1 MAG: hypothetical protein RE471_08825 [Ferroplasma sp.]